MCDMCKENKGEMVSCQDCGILICFDRKGRDDFISPAYVTNSGDVFCRSCGKQHDLDEWGDEGETYYWPGDDYY